jgi:hypothetical protein
MEINTTLKFVQTAIYSSLILVLVSAIKFNTIRRDYSYFFGFVFAILIATIGDDLLRPKFVSKNNNSIYNVYTMLELPFCAYILYQFHFKKIPKKLITFAAIIFYSVILWEIYNSGINVSFRISSYFASFLEIAICIYTLIDLLENPNESLIYKSVPFWFSLGFLLYNAGTTFLFLLLDKLYSLDESFASVAFFTLNSIFSILFYIFLAISILCLKPKTPSS